MGGSFPKDLRPRELGRMHRILGWWEGRGGFEVGGLKQSRGCQVWPPSWGPRTGGEVLEGRSIWLPAYGFFPPAVLVRRLFGVHSRSEKLCFLGDR